MTDQPEGQKSESANSITNVSGGVNANAEQINVGADVVGRDKIVHIEHYHAGSGIAPSKPKIYHNLPQPDYTRFVGRDQELNWLRERLLPKDRAWQIAITGIGGVGKSALALAIARTYLEQYDKLDPEERFEAIIWESAKEEILTTRGRDPAAPSGLILRSLEDMYAAIARTLDREDITRAASAKDQDRLVQKALTEYRTLLVMDNLESVTDERIKPFLRYLPGQTKAVITSREWVEVADVLPLRGLTYEECEQLLIEESAIRNVTLDTVQRQRLVDLTSGLPLPLKLGVARFASGESFDAVTRWLGNAVGDVPEYCVQGQAELARQRDPNAWSLFLAASLFDRNVGASREALGKVADLSMADLDGGLAQLQRLFLVNRTHNDRFWLLPIVQRYASAQFAIGSSVLIEHWREWLLTYARTEGADLEFHLDRLDSMKYEYPNLNLGIKWNYEHEQWHDLLALCECAWFYAYINGLFGECRDILKSAIEAATHLQDERREARLLRYLARVRLALGDRSESLYEIYTALERRAEQARDLVEIGWLKAYACSILKSRSQLEEMKGAATAVLNVGKQTNDLALQSIAALRLADNASLRQQFDQGLEWLTYAENCAREIGWARQLSWIAHLRGAILLQQCKFDEAENQLSYELAMRFTWGDRRFVAYSKRRLAQIYAATGRLPEARQTFQEAVDMFERLGLTAQTERTQEYWREFESHIEVH